MVKSYNRFEAEAVFGVVSSSNALWLKNSNSSTGRAVTGALETVLAWDIKAGNCVQKLSDSDLTVGTGATVATASPPVVSVLANYFSELLAAGYTDGSIRVFDSRSGQVMTTFKGHKSSITCLEFDASGTRLVSGSRDSNVILWDLVEEVGVSRLRSHRDQVTGVKFLDEKKLITCAKDGLVKIWDLESRDCIETRVGGSEVWAMDVYSDTVMTVGREKEVKVWAVNVEAKDGEMLSQQGSLERVSNDRGIDIEFSKDGGHVVFSGNDKTVELWRRRSSAEIKKGISKKIKRRIKKGDTVDEDEYDENSVNEIWVQVVNFKTSAKIRNVTWTGSESVSGGNKDTAGLLVALTNNSLEYYTLELEDAKFSRDHVIDLCGHRADIRALSLSSDDKMVASTSNGQLKIWNLRTTNCIRSMDCGYALCVKFLPGDALVIVGTKSGQIQLFDVASSSLIDTVDAHEGSLWSCDVSSDGKTVVTGGSDKRVCFWELAVSSETVPGTGETTQKLKLKQTRVLELSDDVLCVTLSSDNKYIACSLLDSTVKVFFVDSLKFYLNLYGHKLPVLAMDISSDSNIIVTCSADKNIKLWGLDFGDCRKSMFGHADSVMSVKFVPGSHNFFSAGKDRLVKYWDGDKFDCIQRLVGHVGEVWALCVSSSGDFVVSGSHDKSIRVWMESDDEIFLEEEREKELEEMYESTLAVSLEGEGQELDEDDKEDAVVDKVHMQTGETLKGGEKLMEALEMGTEDLDLIENWKIAQATNPNAACPPRHVILATLKLSAERHVLNVVEKIKPAQLEDSLLVLPFSHVMKLVRFIQIWTAKEWSIPLVCRVLFFVTRTHHKQIVASRELKPMLEEVRHNIRKCLARQKQEIGYNLAGLRFIKQNWDLHHKKEFIDAVEAKEAEERSQKKRAFGTVV